VRARKITFLADENFRLPIVTGLRRQYPSLDIVTIKELDMLGWEDPPILLHTVALDRILLSHDSHTMPGHFDEVKAAYPTAHFPGVILIAQQMPIGEAIEWVAAVWGASDPDEWCDLVSYLP
jgi:hypothetical protein